MQLSMFNEPESKVQSRLTECLTEQLFFLGDGCSLRQVVTLLLKVTFSQLRLLLT